jgi:hypothetical protein
MAWDRKVPFDNEGMQDYPHWVLDREKSVPPNNIVYRNGFHWRDACEFSDKLYYWGCGRGRSSVTFEWKGEVTGLKFPMFLTDMNDILNRGLVKSDDRGSYIIGAFAMVKRGQNYGIKAV